MSGFTQSRCTIDAKPGGAFSYFDGQISGQFTTLTSPTLIEQEWRMKEWADNVTSKVTITLSAPDSYTCRLDLVQSHVPEHDRYGNRDVPTKVRTGWEQFFWIRIQKMMGYSKVDLD